MKLSIITPAFNVQDYIGKCFDSIASQLASDIEFIVVDDGSNDETLAVLESKKKCYPQENVIIIKQNNQGVSAARNNAINIASGQYIAFVDADDCVSGHYIKSIVMAIENSLSPDVITFDYIRFSNDSDIENYKSIHTNRDTSLQTIDVDEFRYQKFRNYLWYPWLAVYKKEHINSDFFPTDMCYEDVATTPFIYLKEISIIRIDVCLYYYRDNPESITNNLTSKHIDDWYKVKAIVYEYIESNGNSMYTQRLMFKTIQAIRVNKSKLGLSPDRYPSWVYKSLLNAEFRRFLSLGDVISMLPIQLYKQYEKLKLYIK